MTRVPTPLQTFVVPSFISKYYQQRIDDEVHGRTQTLLESRTDSLEEQRERQLVLLNEILAHATKHVPYYREKYEGFPTKLDAVDEISTLPVLTKEDVKQNTERLVSEAYNVEELHQESTSGSTGKPLSVFIDDDAAAWQQAHQLRHYREMGYEWGDKIAVIWGEGRYFRVKELKDKVDNILRNKRELRTFELSEEEVREYSRFLEKYDPDIIESYPSALVLLSKAIEDQGLSVSPKAVQTTSEMLGRKERQYVESVMDAPVYNKYGASEVGPIAMSCMASDGMHINTESIIVETDDENRVYVTNLRNYSMPLIRYRVGDFVRKSDDETPSCPCGSTLPQIEEIRGKTNDLVVTTTGSYLDPYFFVDMMDRRDDIQSFKIVQHEDLSIEVLITPASEMDLDGLEQHVRSELAAVDERLQVSVEFVEEVPKTEGWKRRYVLSEADMDSWE